MKARLREFYTKTVAPALMKEFGYTNIMAVPKLEKVTLNVGLGEATQNPKLMDPAVNELASIAGQKPVVTKAKKSIAAFKLRENMSIGCMVTLRGDRMYEFMDRLMNVALPRVRDFRGVSKKSFDGRTILSTKNCPNAPNRFWQCRKRNAPKSSASGRNWPPLVQRLLSSAKGTFARLHS